MVRSPVPLGGLLALLLVAGLALLTLAKPPGHGPVYTVAQVQAHLAHQPGGWVGRTVRVRGIAIRCSDPSGGPHCLYEQPQLLGRWGAPAAESLPLDWDASSPPLIGALRQVPLLGRLLPAPQVLRWGADATYRVQARVQAHASCGASVCYEAVLLDAAPGAPPGEE